ncbi:MAG: TonB-dependent receptor [Steroidobacteraceae bacterium]|jgi:outer membrane receptor protein involved in Fe transport|nr:TonB-dependent receptor [Steroidobacteraceae bacterium]
MYRRPTPLQAAISLVLVVAAAGPAQAQAQAPASSAALEEVVVTGSRIQRDPNQTAPAPIASVTSEDLRASGATDTTATLRQIPALISSGTVADSIERGAGGIGQAVLNLRQLGANRTLVLVDGYRHVSGVAGSQAVDVSTIPSALIERVDVLTGGASAVYGADAVTGVVNYVLRQDFEGLEFDLQPGVSSEGDGDTFRVEATWGKNFADGRGNLTVSAGYTEESEVLLGDRGFTANNGRANNSTTYGNPLRRFQQGDIDPATMPNFASRFSLDAGRFPYGFSIPTPTQAADLWPGGLTAAEQALIDRAANAPLYLIGRDPRFAISSGAGLLWRADFGDFNTDLNNNGLTDCNDSYIGRFAFGFGGACYVTTPGGGVEIFRDGIIATSSNQFGGDGAVERTNETSLIPGSERMYANIRGRFEFTPAAEGFVDAKFASNDTISRNSYNTFYDSLLIFPDNPYIPAVLQGEADDAGGLRVSRDMLDLGDNIQDAERETQRIVLGLRGNLNDHLSYEVVGNYGKTESEVTQANSVLYDRLFAAIDVITGPNGQPICRSDVDPTPHPGSEFFPIIRPGFYTFTPGDGSCRPANILAGEQSISPEAVAFITQPTTTKYEVEQTVFTASLAGDSAAFFELPGGAAQFAVGVEYREEKSDTKFDPLDLGLLPAGSPAGPAGTFIGDLFDPDLDNIPQSLVFDAATRVFDTGGKFDVKEVFAEISLPLLSGARFAEELTFGAAARYADYSTIGGATTWNVNGIWAPVSDVRFRGTYSVAIRAPDIFELFSPQQGTTFRPADPCEQTTIDALLASGDPNAQNRLNNCRAAGIPEGFQDPLSARFAGTTGGNTELTEEEATTYTIGAVFQPRWVEGLLISVDYYSIEIEDAIAAVTSQDIVNTCYDLSTFPNQFCELFTRNEDPASPTFLGLNFLQQTQLNFGRIETAGVDFRVDYRFSVGANNFGLGLTGNWVEKLDRFFDPVDSNLVNPGLKELGAPEWAGLFSATWNLDAFTLNYRMQYIGEQAVASVIQVERIDLEFGDAGWADEYYVHDLSANYQATDQINVYGGVSNLTDEEPYLASSAYPVSGMGRFYFLGVKVRL